MTIKIGQAKAPPSRDQISHVERMLGAKLPAAYLDFLSYGNGGVPDTNIFRISDKNDSGINAFISFDNIPYESGLLREQISSDFVPVAYAEGGNYICVAMTGIEAGSVYFLDHEIPGAEALTKLAVSLPAFLDAVKPFDPKQIKLKPGQVKKAWIDPSLLK